MFILYINDITNITDHKCILYADDISIIVTSNKNNILDYENEINKTIDKLIEWLNINNFKINLNKSKFNNLPNISNSLNIHKIDRVTQI